jgi:uncharacterized membrane protein YcjF (UPF0283 family)
MPSPDYDDPLDALLLEHDAHVDDGGFTARVMTSLPKRRRSWVRPAILSSATLLGLALFIWLSPLVTDTLHYDLAKGVLMTFSWQSMVTLAVLLTGALSLGWGLFAMLKWED